MIKKYRKSLSAVLLTTLSISALASEVRYKEYISQNASNISLVTVGMSKQEVLDVMGSNETKVRDGPLQNPWKMEIHLDTEILHYLTRNHPPFTTIRDNQATPVIIQGGKVSGIGRRFVESAILSAIESSPIEGKTVEERMATLQNLYQDGIIDDDEYEVQKQRILDSI